MNPGPAPPTWEPSANRITSQSLWVLHLQSGVNFVPVRTRSIICRTPTLLCDSQRCRQMATVLCCGRQKPLGTHGDSSSQGPRGSRPAVSSPRAAHTGPLERGPQSHRPPGPPDPTGGQRRAHAAEAGSARRALFWAAWHGRPPRLPDPKSRLCFCPVSGPERTYLLHGLSPRESLAVRLSSSRKC